MFRYLGFQKFEIGEQKPDVSDKGKEITVADYGLVVGAKWTVRCQKKVILSSSDFKRNGTRTDERGRPFYDLVDSASLRLESVTALANGDLFLLLSDGWSLTVTCCVRRVMRFFEYWRLMPKNDNARHLVLEEDGSLSAPFDETEAESD